MHNSCRGGCSNLQSTNDQDRYAIAESLWGGGDFSLKDQRSRAALPHPALALGRDGDAHARKK
jgi:hypothetical protein